MYLSFISDPDTAATVTTGEQDLSNPDTGKEVYLTTGSLEIISISVRIVSDEYVCHLSFLSDPDTAATVTTDLATLPNTNTGTKEMIIYHTDSYNR